MADNNILHTAEILKTALPFVDVRTKTTMDLLVKAFEFMHCLTHFRKSNLAASGFEKQDLDTEALLNKIRPACDDKEKEFIDRILGFFNAKRMFDMYNTYMSAMKTMQEFGGSPGGSPDADAENIFGNFSGFDFSSIFGNDKKAETEPSAHSETVNDSTAAGNAFESSTSGFGDYYSPNNSSNIKNDTDVKGSSETPSSGDSSDNMYEMLKGMIPPEQMSTFENLRMLFNSMSYDNNNKDDQHKE